MHRRTRRVPVPTPTLPSPLPLCLGLRLGFGFGCGSSRFHRATAPSLIKHFRDCIKNAPRELYANVLLTAGPADKDSLVVIQMCYVGPRDRGMEYLQAISSWDGERCLLNEVNEKSFLKQQDSVAQVLRGKGASSRRFFCRLSLPPSPPLPAPAFSVIFVSFVRASKTPG